MDVPYKFTDKKAPAGEKRLSANRADGERRALDRDPAAYIGLHTITGHAYESHVAVSDRRLLDNVLSQNKIGDTVYSSPEMERFCTSEILYANMERIQDFASSAMPGDKQAYFAEFTDPDTGDPMYVGRGYINGADNKHRIYSQGRPVRAIDTSIAAVVVRANPDAAGGWEITTSYPASHPDLEPRNRNAVLDRKEDVSALMRQTDTYQRADPVKRAYMDVAFTGKIPDGLSMSYQGYRGAAQPPRLQIGYEDQPYRPAARVVHEPGLHESKIKYPGGPNRVRPEIWGFANDMKDRVDENVAADREKEKSLPKANGPLRQALGRDVPPPVPPDPSRPGRDTGNLPDPPPGDPPSGPREHPGLE